MFSVWERKFFTLAESKLKASPSLRLKDTIRLNSKSSQANVMLDSPLTNI